ncbi:MAG: GNAT family N-acetyltransferase [Candidatus Eisenbacteria bacterium]
MTWSEGMDERERILAIEAIERRAWVDGDEHMPPDVRAALGRRVARWGEVLAIATDSNQSVIFNRTIGVGLDRPVDEALLDAIAAHYAAGPHDHAVQPCPIAEPRDLAERLARRGYGHYFSWIKWWRDTTPAPAVETTLRITTARPDEAPLVRAVATAGFGLPPVMEHAQGTSVGRPGWCHLLAWDGDTSVATAALFVGGDTGWLGGATTLPSHRGRGAQRALIAARIDAARAAGCRLLAVETGPDHPERPNPSYRNMARMGFQIAYPRPSWVYPDPGRR